MSQTPQFTVTLAESTSDLAAVAELISNLINWLDVDISFQNPDEEIRTLPGKYSPKVGGALLVAKSPNGEGLGCVCLRRLSPETGEVKRLWVSEKGRGLGLGRKLVDGVVEAGRNLGYKELKLDTLRRMEAAMKIYKSHGFEEIPAYYETPIEGTVFLCKKF